MRARAERSRMTHRFIVSVVALAMTLFVAAPASAQTSAAQGYDESGVIGNIEESPTPGADDQPSGEAIPDEDEDSAAPAPSDRESGAPPTAGGGELPFTGLDAALIAVVGMALVGTGFALRRSQRSLG